MLTAECGSSQYTNARAQPHKSQPVQAPTAPEHTTMHSLTHAHPKSHPPHVAADTRARACKLP